jgi:hypothetical protein
MKFLRMMFGTTIFNSTVKRGCVIGVASGPNRVAVESRTVSA